MAELNKDRYEHMLWRAQYFQCKDYQPFFSGLECFALSKVLPWCDVLSKSYTVQWAHVVKSTILALLKSLTVF